MAGVSRFGTRQLCINFANEKLQQHFNSHMILWQHSVFQFFFASRFWSCFSFCFFSLREIPGFSAFQFLNERISICRMDGVRFTMEQRLYTEEGISWSHIEWTLVMHPLDDNHGWFDASGSVRWMKQLSLGKTIEKSLTVWRRNRSLEAKGFLELNSGRGGIRRFYTIDINTHKHIHMTCLQHVY